MSNLPANPFTIEQVAYYIRTLTKQETLLYILAGIVCAIANHVTGAPRIWQALATIALVSIILDAITGTLRSRYIGNHKHCADPHPNCPNRRSHDKRGFNSRDFGATIIKFCVYGIMFLTCTVLDIATSIYLAQPGIYIVSTLALAIIAGREVTSNIENCKALFVLIREPWPFRRVERTIEAATDILLDAGGAPDEESEDSEAKKTPQDTEKP